MDDATDFSRLEALLAEERWVRKLARRLCADPGTADDLVQDAWVAALEHPPRDGERLRAWLRTVLTNLARAGRRSGTARAARERAAARAEAQDSTESVVERAERSRWLAEHALALAEPYRSTVLWRYFDGLSAEAIARREGIAASTVRTRLERGLAQLRERLERERGKHWSFALFPLVELPLPAAANGAGAGAALLGGIGMTAASKVALAVAGVLGIVWFAVPREDAPAPSSGPEPLTVRAHVPDEPAPAPADVEVRRPAAARVEVAAPPDEPATATPRTPDYFDLITDVPPGRIEGLVLRGTQPVDGGAVAFWPGHWRPLSVRAPGESATGDEPESVVIGPDGRFRILDLEPGWYSLAVDLGTGISAQVNARVHERNKSRTIVIVLGTASIHGYVYDEEGARVAGAAICISHDALDESTSSSHYTWTALDGGYRVDDLPAGPCWFTVDLQGRVGAGAQLESMRNLDPLTEGEVRVVDHGSPMRAALWTGKILARASTPVPGPGTLGVSNEATDDYSEASTATDGSFELRLRPGTYTVWTRRDGRSVDLGTHEVGTADFHRNLELPGASIVGRWQCAADLKSDLRISLHYSDGRPAHTADVGQDGSFRFDGVSPGQWTVRAYPLRIQGGEPTLIVLEGDVELFVDLKLEAP